MLVGAFVIISDYTYSDRSNDGLKVLILIFIIFYFIYKVVKLIMDGAFDDLWETEDYSYSDRKNKDYSRYKPKSDYRWGGQHSSHIYNHAEEEAKKVEKITEQLKLRNDIRVIAITKKE